MSIPFTLRVFPHPLPSPWDVRQQSLKNVCFHKEKTPQEEWEHTDRYYGKKDRDHHILAIVDEEIVASVTTLKRTIAFDGQDIVLGGIGGVCTHPNFRRQGISLKLLQIAMTELEKTECDLAYLCTDLTEAGKWLYPKVGFVPLHHAHTYVGESGRRYTDTDGMIAPLRSPSIFEKILQKSEPFDIGVGNW